MFQLYSRGCEHILSALSSVDRKKLDQRFTAKEICKRAGIPESFTRKNLQALARSGVLKAATGPGGGYHLAHQPQKISVLKIINVIDGEDAFDQCVMGLPACRDNSPCPLHQVWMATKKPLLQQLETVTLYDLINQKRRRKEN